MKKFGKILAAVVFTLMVALTVAACNGNKLPKPTGLKVTGTLLSWDYVDYSSGYLVDIDGETYETTKTNYSLASLTVPKEYNIKVKAIASEGRVDSDWSDTYVYSISAQKLATPMGLAIINATLSWNSVSHASSYLIDVDGTTFTSALNTYSLANLLEIKTFDIKVKAVGNGVAYSDSDFSEIKQYEVKASKDLEYTLLADERSYSVAIGTCKDVIIAIPDTHVNPETEEALPITEIADNGFYEQDKIKGVRLPSTITAIGSAAFYQNNSLTSINLPEGLLRIGENAFYSSSNLVNLSIPSTVTRIDPRAFSSTAIRTAHIPSGVTNLPERVFSIAKSLVTITGGENVTTISQYAFSGAERLESITLGSKLTKIEARAFEACKRLASISIPDSVTQIESYAFINCSSLKNLEIGSGLQRLGYELNQGGNAPEGEVWDGCNELENITVKEGSTYKGGGNCLILKASKEVILGGKNSVIPEGIELISDSAFKNRKTLKSIVIPDSVVAIGTNAFLGCEALETVEMGENVEEIFDYAFRGCLSLKSITIPSKLKDYLPTGIFQGCMALKTIVIPSNITAIKGSAFINCTSLETVIIAASVKSILKDAFSGCNAISTVYFMGTSSGVWGTITIETGNTPLTNAARYYYSATQPQLAGDYWHYVDDIPTQW